MDEREIPIEERGREGTEPDAVATGTEEAPGEPNGGARAAAAEREAEEVREEIDRLRDRLLRLQAEFDNFRKREARERAAAWARAKADLSQKLLGAIDDLERFSSLDPDETAARSVIEGVGLVERKVLETLEREGLSSVGEVGEPFDPNVHEAIAVLPAPSADQAGTVANVISRGYRFGKQLLRPARVQVFADSAEEERAGPEGS